MFRYWLFIVFIHVAISSSAQHVELNWYVLKSVEPMDAIEGKMALSRIQQITSDSLSTFVDRDDYFSVATHTPIDWISFETAMENAGYHIADITHGSTHHEDYVKMGLAYQQSDFLLEHPDQISSLTAPIILTPEEFELLSPLKQLLISSYPNQFLIKE